MAYSENPLPDNLYQKEEQLAREEMRARRRSWIKSHITAIYIGVGLLLAAAIFFGIKWYNDSTNPVSRFVGSSGKTLGTSFSFVVSAEKNGTPVMTYYGSAEFNASAHSVTAVYDADYNDYTYRGVLYTDASRSYRGNCYRGQWTVTDCTERVQEYFDFFSDYRKGSFDSGSFLRFTGLNHYLNAEETDEFMQTVKSRLSTDSAVATVITSHEGDVTVYNYDINLKEMLNLIRYQGASVFFTSTDYNAFIARLDANLEAVDAAKCSLSFTVNGSGYLSDLHIGIDTGVNLYTLRFSMDEFGSAAPLVPEEFLTAAEQLNAD